ncbi:potassium channel family protein [Peribacillus asahii]|uniref:potassium channel family protein n=1 Tax=Peribacillus asahii TaxID=228899 RepID=UPI003826FB7E
MSYTNIVSRKFSRIPYLLKLLSIVFVFLFLFGTLIHLIEPDTFPKITDGIWWVIVTIATVGYGDYAPKTLVGRIIGTILILTGVGILTSYFASIAKVAISKEEQFLNGTKTFNGSNHYIIVGWNERSKTIIEEIHERRHEQAIVLIDNTLRQHPLPRTNIHFVHGRATVDDVLLKANIREASLVLITTDFKQNEMQTDMFSILTLLAVKGLNPNVYCLVEILTQEQKENARRAGADGLVETNKFASEYILHFLLSGHAVEIQGEWFGIHIAELAMQHEWAHLTFQQLSNLLLEQDILLIGIMRGGKRRFKPPAHTPLQANDSLLIMAESY